MYTAAVQQVLKCRMWCLPADHPIMLALTTAVAVGIYICSDPLLQLHCPILSSVVRLHS